MQTAVIVKASFAKYGNVAPKKVEAVAARLGVMNDGGGLSLLQGGRAMYDNWYIAGSEADAKLFARETNKLGFRSTVIK